jgi:hypothetical protein
MDIPSARLPMRRSLSHSLSQLTLTERLSPPTDKVFDDNSLSSTWQRSSPPSPATSFCSNGVCPSRPQSRASSFGSDNSGLSHPPRSTRRTKVVTLSFSRLARASGESVVSVAAKSQRLSFLEINVPRWINQLRETLADRDDLKERVEEWETLLGRAKSPEDLATLAEQVVEARLDWFDYNGDVERLEN